MRNNLKLTTICLFLAAGQLIANIGPDVTVQAKTYKYVTASNLIIYMTIVGIPGENDIMYNNLNVPNTIALKSYNFSEENSVSIGSITGGGGAGKAVPPVLEMQIYLENAVIDLYKKMMKGEMIPEVKIFIYRPLVVGNEVGKVEEINIKNVWIEKIEAAAVGDTYGPVLHNVTMKFEAIKKLGTPYNNAGVPQAQVESKWNYKKNSNDYDAN